jgi:sodium/potassium-transporting ATPase subunit alpha
MLIENSSYQIEASREKNYAEVKKVKDTGAKGRSFPVFK